MNNTDSSIHPGAQPEEVIEEYRKEIRENIEYDRLQKYFPTSYTPKQMEDVIIKLLEGCWRAGTASGSRSRADEKKAAIQK